MWMLFFLLLPTYAQKVEPNQNAKISLKYFEGNYLIYDCEDKHWSCVNKESFEFCQKLEKDSQKFSISLRCQTFKSFGSNKNCEKKQYDLVHKAWPTPFCWDKKFKEMITQSSEASLDEAQQ